MIHALVPVTEQSDRDQGIAMAISLAKSPDVTVELITVIPADGSVEHLQAAARVYLDTQIARFSEGARVQGHVRQGDPVEELLQVSREFGQSVLVLSPRWSEEAMSFMPDSVSEQILMRAEFPVLLATTSDWPRALFLENVMVPVTLTSPSVEQILSVTGKLLPQQPVLRLVYVASGSEEGFDGVETVPCAPFDPLEDSAGYQARLRLLELGAELRRHGVRSTWELRYGDPVHELTRAAATTGANLIVFDWTAADPDSRSERNKAVLRVSHNASTPVMMLPAGVRGDRSQERAASSSATS